MNCNKDIVGDSCRCKECKPRSKAQLRGDRIQSWKKWNRSKMECLPEFIDCYRREVLIDPIVDELEGETFMSELPYEEHIAYDRGDCVPLEHWDSIHKVSRTKRKKWKANRKNLSH